MIDQLLTILLSFGLAPVGQGYARALTVAAYLIRQSDKPTDGSIDMSLATIKAAARADLRYGPTNQALDA